MGPRCALAIPLLIKCEARVKTNTSVGGNHPCASYSDNNGMAQAFRAVAPLIGLVSMPPQICCSSPERFLSGGRGGLLEARPIKGTASRVHGDPAADAAAARALLASEKVLLAPPAASRVRGPPAYVSLHRNLTYRAFRMQIVLQMLSCIALVARILLGLLRASEWFSFRLQPHHSSSMAITLGVGYHIMHPVPEW